MKKIKIKSLLALLLNVCVVLSMTACGNEDTKKTSESETKQSASESETKQSESSAEVSGESSEEEWPTISVTMFGSEETDFSENYAYNWLCEQAKVNIEVVHLPSGEDGATKLNLMYANGDYPDVIVKSMNKATAIELGKEGIFVPINDYINNSVNLKGILEDNPLFYNNAFAPDGNIYGFPSISSCYHCQAYPKMWYNSEWLDALGMDLPTTTEEFKELLAAAKAYDFNENGKEDEIALTGQIQYQRLTWCLLNYFLPYDEATLCYAKDGEVIFAADSEEFKMGLQWIKELYDEGLIDPAAFTQSLEELGTTYRSDPKRTFAVVDQHYGAFADIKDPYSNKFILAMPPVEGPTGAQYQPQQQFLDMSSNFTYFITDNCENVEAAFRLGDTILSPEAYLILQYGEEGTYWGRYEEEVDSCYPGYKALYWYEYPSAEDTEYQKNRFLLPNLNGTIAVKARSSAAITGEDKYTSKGYETRLNEETNKVLGYFYEEYLPKNVYIEDADTNEEFTLMRSSLVEYVKTATAQFVVGEMDIESEWETYVNTLKGYGSEEYVKIYQEVYDEFRQHNN